jgi:general secretion pathway protein G
MGEGLMERGFTLIELLIVVAIIGIIAAISIPSLQTAIDKAKQRGSMADMRSLGQAVNFYQIDESIFPANGSSGPTLASLLAKYSKSTPPVKDRWNRFLVYSSDAKRWYSIESYGKDGIDGLDISPITKLQFELDIVYASGQFTASPE